MPPIWALLLPEAWTEDRARRAEVGIPPTVTYQTKGELALGALDRVRGWGLQPRPVLADTEFGNTWEFREALRTRGYLYCVQVEATTVAWTPLAPREETCLVEWSAEKPALTKYWLADLRGEPLGLRRLVRLAKGRWRIEQDYRELKDELGLDHFEGRSYTGWYHHMTLVSMAYAFLVLDRVRAQKNLAVDVAPGPAPAPATPPVAG